MPTIALRSPCVSPAVARFATAGAGCCAVELLLTRGQQTSLPAPERNPMTVATALELSLLHENVEHVAGTQNCQC
jgi:hypothetical protein